MGDDEIHAIATAHASALPGSVRTQPFGPDAVVFKVQDKMFCLIGKVDGRPTITMKCDPDRSAFLRDHLPSIRPGYHMNKRHWITVAAGPGVDADLLQDLLTAAHHLVCASLPKALRQGLI